ncbi:peroxidase family protein [Nocardioides sp. YIM 152588]|uniref:peroxidase family protein n=1 Tax=Nocardioides sp. YIM 152588 TaxID=3158259 RepID=UPI0032E3BF37
MTDSAPTGPTGPRTRGPAVPRDPVWSETYAGGSAAAERAEFEELARRIMSAQLVAQEKAGAQGVPHALARTLHAKATLAVDDAELRFRDDLAEDLRHGFAQPGAAYRTVVRFSNAGNVGAADFEQDLRGLAMRVVVDEDTSHDLLGTNWPVSHARDARQFVEFAHATAGSGAARAAGVVRLVRLFGAGETKRMLENVLTARKHQPGSVFTETYFSRGAFCWGPSLAVRFLVRPAPETATSHPSDHDPSYLTTEAVGRLSGGPVRMELCVQRYQDPESTPIEDTAVAWTEAAAPAEHVADLVLRQADLTTPQAQQRAEAIEPLAFNPWNTTEDFRPLGNLNRARKAAYDASAAARSGTRWLTETPTRNVVAGAAARAAFSVVNRRREWYLLPVRTSVLNLEAFRHVLRERNLIDTDPADIPPTVRPVPAPPPEEVRWARTPDGSFNDLSVPSMGAIGSAFGRNLPADYRPETFGDPNPVVVSQRLLVRDHFRPAASLNLLAAAWIQFQVHDWVNHARHPLGVDDVKVPMPGGQKWTNTVGGDPENVMRIAGNKSLADAPDGSQRLFANDASHWWDASEVYGSDPERMATVREGAKIRLTDEGYLPQDVSGQDITGFNESWWLGLSSMHTLFAREHNAVCDELRAHYRGWSDERVYQTARLVVAALIAKIHTVEWTPAILATEAIDLGLNANWYGPPSGDWLTKLGIWLMDTHASVGIPETTPDHHTAPYSLTEDFVTVYRLHPLIPDDYEFRAHTDGRLLGTATFADISSRNADDVMRRHGLGNVLYSLGTAHPGAITLHNFPRSLCHLERDGEIIDLSVIDLVRTRRRGVPRFNDFRTGLHKPPIRDFDELSSDPATVAALRELYRSVDEVDTVVGLLGEEPPPGFGFSDTAFRIFILMASRRLQSDRFLTVDFRPEIYSPVGMDWVAQNTMTSVILRHFPEAATLLPRGRSAFAPWRTATGAGVSAR